MVTNKAILGFFVVLIVVVLAIVLVRRNPNFMARFRSNNEATINRDVTSVPDKNITPGTVAGEQVPAGRTTCTPELKAKCTATESPVCGYEKVVSAEGETERALTYKSACNYCSLYGIDDVLDLGDEKYYPLGYTPGACTK